MKYADEFRDPKAARVSTAGAVMTMAANVRPPVFLTEAPTTTSEDNRRWKASITPPSLASSPYHVTAHRLVQHAAAVSGARELGRHIGAELEQLGQQLGEELGAADGGILLRRGAVELRVALGDLVLDVAAERGELVAQLRQRVERLLARRLLVLVRLEEVDLGEGA